MKRKIVGVIGIGILTMSMLTGCMTDAQKELSVADGKSNPWVDFDGRDGGRYIIINSSGGVVMDVWKAEDKLVSSIDSGDGWEFVDSKGNLNRVGGDALIIRCDKNDETWNKYKEYHWDNTNAKEEINNDK